QGELVAFLDSDDIWHPQKLELQLQYLEGHPETALVGAVSFVDPTRAWPALPDSDQLPGLSLALEDFVLRCPFATSTVVVRKHCLNAVGDFDTGLRNAEDRDMYIRLRSRYRVSRLDAVLVWGRLGGEHLSMGSASAEQATLKMIRGAFDRIDSL